jgi:hypothetical protein
LTVETIMDKSTLDILTERIDRLERQNRRLRQVGGCVLIGVTVLGAVAAKPADTAGIVRAVQLFLVHEDGGEIPSERAALTTTPHDGTILVLRHKGPNPSPQIALNAAPDDRSFISINGADGKLRIYLGLEPDGQPKLLLQDEHGKELFRAPAK